MTRLYRVAPAQVLVLAWLWCGAGCGASQETASVDELCAVFDCAERDASVDARAEGDAGAEGDATTDPTSDAGRGNNDAQLACGDGSCTDPETRASCPSDCGDVHALCPDGVIDRPVLDGWARTRVTLNPGDVRRFCAPVHEPYLPATVVPRLIKFAYYDESDRGCGSVHMRVEQLPLDPAHQRVAYEDGPSAGGNVNYLGTWGPWLTPENVPPGVYIITLTGHQAPTACRSFKVSWQWQ